MEDDRKDSWIDDPTKLADVVRQLEMQHSARLNHDKAYLRLYWDRPTIPTSDPLRPYAELYTYETMRATGQNLVREILDADVAQICQPLHCKVTPVGAEPQTARSCEMMTRLVDGVMDVCEFADVATRCYVDGGSSTAGWVEVFIDENAEIKVERVEPLNVLWHYDEGANPVQLYSFQPVSRIALIARYPQHAERIGKLTKYTPPSIAGVTPPGMRGGDCVRVDKGWRIRQGREIGRHTVVAGDLVLENGPYTYDFHMLIPICWSPDYSGVGGVPLARLVAGDHVETNMSERKITESLDGAVPKLIAHEDSMVSEISDLPYELIRWTGPTPPVVTPTNPVSQDLIAHIERKRERSYARVGVNPQAAQGTRPQGLNSAPAQREWIDIVSLRGRWRQATWAKFWKQVGRAIIALAAIAYKDKKARVMAPGTDLIEEIDFPKDLKESQYEVTFALASGLSQTISGKLEQLDMLGPNGMQLVDRRDVARNIGLPDIKSLSDRLNAPRDLAELMINKALKDGQFVMPSAIQGADGLAELIKIASEEYQRAMLTQRYPPEHVETLRKLIKAAQARQPQPPAPAPPQPAPQPMPGPEAGAPPPLPPEAAPPVPAPTPPQPMPVAA
jgi:hypothetical protein